MMSLILNIQLCLTTGKIRKEYVEITELDFHVMAKQNFLDLVS